jgi:hypothetical protein
MDVEIIDFIDTGEQVQRNYRYLTVKRITDIDDVISFHRRLLPGATPHELQKEMEVRFTAGSAINPFQAWLDAKIDSLVNDGVDVVTKKQFVYNFYNKVP